MKAYSIEDYRALIKPSRKKVDTSKAKLQAAKLAQEVELHLITLPGHEKEFIFHPTRKWRLDYAWPKLKVGLEIHGGIYTNGRHTKGSGITEDRVKMNSAQLLGWIVIEATTEQVKKGLMLDWITQAIALRGNNAPD